MDYKTYQEKYFAEPAPTPRFQFEGMFGYSLYIKNYQAGLDFYTKVLGPPNYIEGANTHGWQLGVTWLSLFPADEGQSMNVEPQILMSSPAEVDRLYQAFVAAGATGNEPSDEIMYVPLRFSALTDPFGTQFLILAKI